MLVGRERERRRIQALVAAARVGLSGVLVLTGEAGIGKTALLDDAAVGADGMCVLRATGTEPEVEVPFGALLQLLRPALVHLDRIPSPQAAALASALALREGTGADRFAVGAATLSLLSRFAEDQPLAVLIDDAHLLDLPSAQALVFATRRLTADPIVVLVAVREGHPCPFTAADLPVAQIDGLTLAATGDLLEGTGRTLGDPALLRLHELTGGNPLAVVELADDADALGRAPVGAPVVVPASLVRAFGRRLDQLSEPARTIALVAAVGGGDLDLVARACGSLGVELSALAEAEDAGLLRLHAERVVFRHSLVGSAVYSQAAPVLRRSVHRALAAALPPDDLDRRTWHLGQAALGPDESIALALAAVADQARARGAHAVAAAALERAARLTPDTARRIDRLLAAGDAAWRAGLAEHAVTLLARASELHPLPAVRVRITGLRGVIAARTGSVEQARDLFMAAVDDLGDSDADTSVLLLAEAILACFFLADTATVRRAADRIDRLADRSTTSAARIVGTLASGVADVLTARGGTAKIRTAVEQVGDAELLAQDARVAPWLVLGPLFLREGATGDALVQTVVESLRRRSAVGGLPLLLFHLARDQATTDRWDVAALTYAEGVRLAREAAQVGDLAACLAGMAGLEARQGREAQCRQHAAEALALCRPRRLALFECWSLFALGDLELGLGRPEAALTHLHQLDVLLDELDLIDVDVSPAPELVEALTQLGRTGQAREAARRYAGRAADKGQPWALARAARAVALTSGDAELDKHFQRALDHHSRTPDTFELARTELVYGSRLRRSRRRIDARPLLRAALARFESLGAAPWADRAAHELRATGESAQRRGVNRLHGLTPQELQVARMLAGGRSTREAAAALFLSPKTVEYHLRHVYMKLGIGSRAELAEVPELTDVRRPPPECSPVVHMPGRPAR